MPKPSRSIKTVRKTTSREPRRGASSMRGMAAKRNRRKGEDVGGVFYSPSSGRSIMTRWSIQPTRNDESEQLPRSASRPANVRAQRPAGRDSASEPVLHRQVWAGVPAIDDARRIGDAPLHHQAGIVGRCPGRSAIQPDVSLGTLRTVPPDVGDARPSTHHPRHGRGLAALDRHLAIRSRRGGSHDIGPCLDGFFLRTFHRFLEPMTPWHSGERW